MSLPSNLACDHAQQGDYVMMCHDCANTLEREREEANAAIRAAMHIFRESAPSSFAGAWLPDFEKVHAAAITRATGQEGAK